VCHPLKDCPSKSDTQSLEELEDDVSVLLAAVEVSEVEVVVELLSAALLQLIMPNMPKA
jgi:hypothetical protein